MEPNASRAGEACALPAERWIETAVPELRVRHDDPRAPALLARSLAAALRHMGGDGPPLIVCIGTDRATGDALGPLVGSLLHEHEPLRPWVVGTLDDPVHATNLEATLQRLRPLQARRATLAVDACLGRQENVGTIAFGRGPLQPGAGVNKTLPPVGDFYMTGTVNVGGFMEYFVLQNTRLSLVVRMARVMARAIVDALQAAGVGRLSAPA